MEVLLNQKGELPKEILEKPGRIDEVPEWYYDTSTNSLLNGGLKPGLIIPTQISITTFKKIVKMTFQLK